MHSSNPIIAVGISAVIAIGSATTAEAKPVPNLHDSFPGKLAQAIEQAETEGSQTEGSQTEGSQVEEHTTEAISPPEATESAAPYANLLEALRRNTQNTSEEENTSEETVIVQTEAPEAQPDPEAPSNSGEAVSSEASIDSGDTPDISVTNTPATNTPATSGTPETAHETAQNEAPSSEGETETPEAEVAEPDLGEELAPTPSDLPPQDEQTPLDDSPVEEIESPAEAGDTTGTAPEYLDPNPNPLFFPTDPSEVEIVGTQPITLQQAIELGIRNNEELQESRLQLERTRSALREQEAANYPRVTAGANLNFQAEEQPNQVQTPTGEVEVDGSNIPNSLVLGGQLQVSYNIFTSGQRSALIQAAEGRVRSQELQIEVSTEDLVQEVATRYYDLQQADEQTKISQAALDEAQRSLRDAQALERAGVGTRFDVLQAQVDVANAQQDLRNQQSQQEIARRQLAEVLNISQSLDLAASEPVEVAGTWELTLEDSIVTAYRNRAELEQLLIQREIAEDNRRAELAELGPQVSLTGTYGLSNTLASDTGTDATNPADDFGFLSSFQAQLGVNMLLYDGGQARARARQAEADIAIAETNFANQRDLIRFRVEQAYSQLQANFENIQTTALAVQQAEEALRLARLRFQAGVGTQTDVLRSQTELTRSRFNNLRAILDYNRALVALQRQVSNLPEGFLNQVP